MKNCIKKMTASILTLAIIMTLLLSGNPLRVSAASWKVAYKTDGIVTVPSGQSFEVALTTKTYGKISWQTTLLNTKIGYTVTIYDSEGNKVGDAIQVSADDSAWKSQQQAAGTVYYHVDQFQGVMAGNFYIHVTFDSDSDTQAMFSAQTLDDSKNMPALVREELTVTAGFKEKLSVRRDTIKKCSSSDKSIATVTSKGEVTGKKKGTATITVTTTKGVELTCKVNVKANTYSAAKITSSDVRESSYDIKAYSAKYDSKGNLVVKAMAVNNMSTKVKVRVWVDSLKNLSDTKKMITLTLPANSAKSVTLKFPKSSLVKNKKNLPVSGIQVFNVPLY